MKKRLSHFAYNERSRSAWTLTIPRLTSLSPIRSTIKLFPMSPARSLPLSPVYTGETKRGSRIPPCASYRQLGRDDFELFSNLSVSSFSVIDRADPGSQTSECHPVSLGPNDPSRLNSSPGGDPTQPSPKARAPLPFVAADLSLPDL